MDDIVSSSRVVTFVATSKQREIVAVAFFLDGNQTFSVIAVAA